MANITKRGESYRIRVFSGYNNNKQIVYSMTWKPPNKMSQKQLEKELQRQIVLFEEKCKNNNTYNLSIKFYDFVQEWLSEYAEKNLKAKTVSRYKELLKKINEEFGNLNINKIQPLNIIKFYNKLVKIGSDDIKYKVIDSNYLIKLILDNYKNKKEFCIGSNITLITLNNILKKYNLKYETALKISNALNKEINELFQKNEKKPLSTRTIQHYHRLLSSIFQTAVQWQIINDNPCQRVKPPRIEFKESSYLEDTDIIKLLEYLKKEKLQYRVIITTLIYTGMRRGEILGLKWSDVDFDDKTINIQREILYLPKKGVFEDTTKNNSSKRIIKVSDNIFKLLIEHKKEQNLKILKNGKSFDNRGYIFTTSNGKPINPDTLTNWFKKFINKNELPYANIHSLRHTNASLLIANGINIATVSKRLGHSSTNTTAKIYAHAINKADEIASNTIQNILDIKQIN